MMLADRGLQLCLKVSMKSTLRTPKRASLRGYAAAKQKRLR